MMLSPPRARWPQRCSPSGACPCRRSRRVGLLHNLPPEQVGRFLTRCDRVRRAAGRRWFRGPDASAAAEPVGRAIGSGAADNPRSLILADCRLRSRSRLDGRRARSSCAGIGGSRLGGAAPRRRSRERARAGRLCGRRARLHDPGRRVFPRKRLADGGSRAALAGARLGRGPSSAARAAPRRARHRRRRAGPADLQSGSLALCACRTL